MKKIVCGLLLLCIAIKTVSASDELSEQRSPSPFCQTPDSDCQTPDSGPYDSMYQAGGDLNQKKGQDGEDQSQKDGQEGYDSLKENLMADDTNEEDKEKKLIDAGLSSFTQALTGCAATSLGYIVTSLAIDEPKLPVVCMLLGGSFPFILKKTGMVKKDLNRTEIIVNGLLLGATLYSVGNVQSRLGVQKMSLLGSRGLDNFENSMVKFATK